jgi:hypothetical protein
MSTLRSPIKFLDTLMNKVNKTEFYMVLHETMHNVWLIDLEGKKEPFEMPKRMVNLAYIVVDPKVVRVLYGDNDEPKTDEVSSSSDDASATK